MLSFFKNAGNFFQVALVVRVPVLSEQMISARWWAELCRQNDATCTALWVRRLRSSSYDHTECCLALWVLHTFTFAFSLHLSTSFYIFLHLSTVIYHVPTGRSKIFQEAVVQPSVSTDGNFLTMAFFLAISEVPGKRLEAAWSFILTTHCPGLGKRPTSVKSQHHAQKCRKCQKNASNRPVCGSKQCHNTSQHASMIFLFLRGHVHQWVPKPHRPTQNTSPGLVPNR